MKIKIEQLKIYLNIIEKCFNLNQIILKDFEISKEFLAEKDKDFYIDGKNKIGEGSLGKVYKGKYEGTLKAIKVLDFINLKEFGNIL